MNYHALCFVDMPFGQKPGLKSGVVVDFDQIYRDTIKPAIEGCGLEAFAFVVADLTLANAKDLE